MSRGGHRRSSAPATLRRRRRSTTARSAPTEVSEPLPRRQRSDQPPTAALHRPGERRRSAKRSNSTPPRSADTDGTMDRLRMGPRRQRDLRDQRPAGPRPRPATFADRRRILGHAEPAGQGQRRRHRRPPFARSPSNRAGVRRAAVKKAKPAATAAPPPTATPSLATARCPAALLVASARRAGSVFWLTRSAAQPAPARLGDAGARHPRGDPRRPRHRGHLQRRRRRRHGRAADARRRSRR